MTLNWAGFHQKLDGYGYATIVLGQGLRRLDASVNIVDMDERGRCPWGTDKVWQLPGTTIALCTPDWYPQFEAERLIGYTMFEATRLPAGWTDKINAHCAELYVPCEWCRHVFQANGVTVPISVVKWGIAPRDYFPLARDPEHTPYTFLWSGTADLRKGWDVAYQAFMEAFGDDKRVELIMHFRADLPGHLSFSDRNVRNLIGLFDRPMLRGMLEWADCFIFPSRGEGWGNPPREAAATGLPVIATDFGGLAEDLSHWALPIDVVGYSPARYGFWEDIGAWAEPSITQLAQTMQWCFEHRQEAADFGEGAANWLRENATYQQTAQAILDLQRSAVC